MQFLLLLVLIVGCVEAPLRYPLGTLPPSCDRGQPRPFLSRANPDILAISVRRLAPGALRERAHLKGRVVLTAFQARCPEIKNVFIFELPVVPRRLDHAPSWYRRAAILLEAAAESSPEAAGMLAIAERIKTAAESAPPLGARIEMGEFQALSVSVGENHDGRKTLVEITYSLKR